MTRITMRTDDGRRIVVHHYHAFEVKTGGIRCEACKAKLDKLECIQIRAEGGTSGPWYCWKHQPFEEVKKH
jgi:hypothetical protein